MLKSMTAFGRANIATPVGRVIVEIQSVNRKHLEINTYFPSELQRFDSKIRGWISKAVNRGQVTIRISIVYDQVAPYQVAFNLDFATQFKSACDKLAKELGIDKPVSLDTVLAQPGVLVVEEELSDEGLFLSAIEQAVQAALVPFVEAKKVEGAVLESDIRYRLSLLHSSIVEIIAKAPEAADRQREKFRLKLEELLPGKAGNEEAVIREAGLYATRVDFTEEGVRLKSHLMQFDRILDSDSAEKGKPLDFLIQEMNREINTIGSKAADPVIAQRVVDVKSQLEKIREQVQNIE